MYRILGADGREYGPVSAEQLRRWIVEGRANAKTKTRAENSAEWKPLAQFPELSSSAPVTPISPPQYIPASTRRTNQFAVTGLVLGILSVTGGICCYGLPFNILGLIFSIIALTQINNHPEQYDGKGMAIIGMILSVLGILLTIGLFGLIALSSAWTEPAQHHFRRL